METYFTNPKKKSGKAHRKGGGKKRRNPLPLANKGKRRGRARVGNPRRNPGFAYVIPGGAGGLLFRLGLRKVGGDKVRDSAGKMTGTGYGLGALMLYGADEIAGWLKFHGTDAAAFGGGMAGVASCFAADELAPDLAREHLYPMTGSPAIAGVAGLGATSNRPMSFDAYKALAGNLGTMGPVVYVQMPDGSVHEVPTGAGVSGPEQIPIPPGSGPGDVIRNKTSGQMYRLTRSASGGLDATPISSLSGTRSEYQAAA